MSGRLNPKSGRFKAGDVSVSAKALNDMQDAIVRQFVGGDQTEVEYYGDRIVIRSNDNGPRNADISDMVTRFVVVEVFDDMLKCAPYRQQFTGSDSSAIWVASNYDAALGYDSPHIVYIAKPEWFRPSFWDGKTINDIYYIRTGIDRRTASHSSHTPIAEWMTPSYGAGDIIHAVMGITGLTAPDGNNVGWTDMNFAGRAWGSNPLPGGTTDHIDTTDNFNVGSVINLIGGTVNVVSPATWNISPGVLLTILGGDIALQAGLELCGPMSWCVFDYDVDVNNPTHEIDDLVLPVDANNLNRVVLRFINSSTDFNVNSVIQTRDGQVILFANATGQKATFQHQTTGTAAHKFRTPGAVPAPVEMEGMALAWYDQKITGTGKGWRLACCGVSGGTGGPGSGTPGFLTMWDTLGTALIDSFAHTGTSSTPGTGVTVVAPFQANGPLLAEQVFVKTQVYSNLDASWMASVAGVGGLSPYWAIYAGPFNDLSDPLGSSLGVTFNVLCEGSIAGRFDRFATSPARFFFTVLGSIQPRDGLYWSGGGSPGVGPSGSPTTDPVGNVFESGVCIHVGTATVLTSGDIGSSVQAHHANLDSLSSTTLTSYGLGFLPLANAAAGRTYLGLGTLATQNGTFSGTSSGTNTGDQSSMVGITSTLAEFNAALSGADFVTGGGTATGTNTSDVTVTGENFLSLAGQVITVNAVNLAGTNVTGTLPIGKLDTGTAANKVVLGGTITAGGPTGAANTAVIITYNAAGQLTAVNTATITPAAIGAPAGSGTSTGTNTGDQTSIVGITGTLAEFNAALTGADLATGGGTATGTNTGDQTTITGNAGSATVLSDQGYSLVKGGIAHRLTPLSATPELSSDATGATTLYLTPTKLGDVAWLSNGTYYVPKNVPEIALPLSGLTNGAVYDVFLYMNPSTPSSTNAGTDILTFSADPSWTTGAVVVATTTGGGLTAGTNYWYHAASTTTGSLHASLADALSGSSKVDLTASITSVLTGITLLSAPWGVTGSRASGPAITRSADGHFVDSIITASLLIGTFVATSTSTTESSKANRYISNLYNPIPLPMESVNDAAGSWTYTTNTIRQANANTANQLNFVCCMPSTFSATADGYLTSTFATVVGGNIGIGLDTTTAFHASRRLVSNAAGQFAGGDKNLQGTAAAGKRFLAWLEQGSGTTAPVSTMTFYSNVGGGLLGINGWVMG